MGAQTPNMYRFLLLAAALFAAASAFPAEQPMDMDMGVTGLWNAFKIDFNKVYSPEEEAHRLVAFKDNVETIYRSGDKPQGELVHLNETDVPSTVDWTTKGAVNPIKNQGQCGSCWAFGTVASVEGINAIKNKKLVSLSEQQLVNCDVDGGDLGCKGGLPDNAFKYVESTGLTTESNYPYTSGGIFASSSRALLGGKGKVCDKSKLTGDLLKITGFKDVKGETQLAAAVAQQPVAVGIDGKSIQHYKSGIFTGSCTGQIDHAVTVVGYGAGYWKVRNSWGTSFGEAGYIRITGGSDACSITNMASYPTM